MSKVFAPPCSTETACAVGIWCPPTLSHCKSGCIEVTKCQAVYIPIEVPTCDPFTGAEITASDLTAVNITVGGTLASDDRYVVAGNYDLTSGVTVLGDDNVLFQPTDTHLWPEGYANVSVTAEIGGQTFQLVEDFKLCISGPQLPEPCLVVSGPNDGDFFVINGDTVTLYLHHSDTGDGGRDWAEFTVDWGDGTIETVTPVLPLDATSGAISHTYTAQPSAGIVVSGTTTFDATNLCDEALTDCTDEICLPTLAIP